MSEGKKSKWQGSDGLTRFGTAGPPVQHSEKITIEELKELIEREDIKPSKLFSKEDFLNDSKIKEKIDQIMKADEEKRKKEENSMIPGDDKPILTPEEKKKQEEDNEFVPDDGKPGDDSDLIPD